MAVLLFAPRAEEAYARTVGFVVGNGLAAVAAAIAAFAAAVTKAGLTSIRHGFIGLCGVGLGGHQGTRTFVRGRGRIVDDLPTERAAKFPQGVGILVAENDEAVRVGGNDEVIAVAPQRYLPTIVHENGPLPEAQRSGGQVVPKGGLLGIL